MNSNISKPKAPKGFTYVLKTTQIEQLFENYKTGFEIDLNYWVPQGKESLLSIDFWTPNERIHYERFYIRIGVVSIADILKTKIFFEEKVFPFIQKILLELNQIPIQSPDYRSKCILLVSRENGIFKINGKDL